MAEQARPCPHCQGTNLKILFRDCIDGGGFVLTCQNGDCIARIWGHDEADVVARWNRRTPGPATKAMIEWIRTSNRELSFGPPADLTKAFFAEWLDPTAPTTPAPPAPSSPWTCGICGQPVRIGDDLRPYHLAGPANHEAELSSEDLKTLADGLRLTD